MRDVKSREEDAAERERLGAWHALMSLVREEANASGHLFLAYLVGLGLEQTRIMLGRKRPSRMARPEKP